MNNTRKMNQTAKRKMNNEQQIHKIIQKKTNGTEITNKTKNRK